MLNFIYLDHAATTPLHPVVLDAMMPYLRDEFGNPSSIHVYGRRARAAVDGARKTIAELLGAEPREITFTSGGTEADNLAIIGTALANYSNRGRHIVTTVVEHEAVLRACTLLEEMGFHITYLPVDRWGQVSVESVAGALRDETVLVSIIYGNNEVGTIQPIAEIGELCRRRNVWFHTDAVQAFGLIPINVKELPIDLLSASAHKINGPKGTGFLYVATKVPFRPFIVGGGQERRRRAGTENVAGIVGFAKAAEIARREMANRRREYSAYRDAMLGVFNGEGLNCEVNGHPEDFLPHILNVSFPGSKTEVILMNLDLAGVAASGGSACAAGSLEPSHVLTSMLGEERARCAVRFSFGMGNTIEQVRKAAHETARIVRRTISSQTVV